MTRPTYSLPEVAAPGRPSVRDEIASGPGKFLARRISNWLRRRRLGRIEELDDRMLDDIGLTRADLVWVRSLSLDHNPLSALNAVARQRRARRFDDLRSPLVRGAR